MPSNLSIVCLYCRVTLSSNWFVVCFIFNIILSYLFIVDLYYCVTLSHNCFIYIAFVTLCIFMSIVYCLLSVCVTLSSNWFVVCFCPPNERDMPGTNIINPSSSSFSLRGNFRPKGEIMIFILFQRGCLLFPRKGGRLTFPSG